MEGARPFFELLNQQMTMADPRRRVLAAAGASFNPAVAVARFVWHLAASSQLASIAFYEPRAAQFSDDGEVLPGSNYGARLFGGESGIDQIAGVVERLREDASSRRAAAVIWRPEDAVRKSRDIPCASGITCHLRGGQLLTTVTMRSNNALRLLPYNLFEFSLLAELIAAELEVEAGPYWHIASSLHVYEDEIEAARSVSSPETARDLPMPSIPPGEGALERAGALVRWESQMREVFASEDWGSLADLVDRAEEELDPYWLGLFCVLVLLCAGRRDVLDRLNREALLARIPQPLQLFLD